MSQNDWWTIIGTIASIAGFGVGVYVIHVTTEARQAAREARVLARKRNLAEALEDAKTQVEQVGDFLSKKEWTAVRIRSQEIMVSCRESLTRWPDGLSEERRNDVLTASSLASSIANEAASADTAAFKNPKLKRLSGTQLQVAQLLSAALGEARGVAERDGD
jgi:hypothetical protein